MAIFTAGVAVGRVSGSVGSITFSHNRGGSYFRLRSVPANPQSSYQLNIRQILAERSAAWRSVVDKAAWNTWASQNPIMNALGESTTLTGHQAYIKLNSRLAQAGDSVITVPPVAVAPTALAALSVTAEADDQHVTLTSAGVTLGADERLWTLACIVDSAGISYVKNYMRQVAISGKASGSPWGIDASMNRFGARIAGQYVWVRASVFSSVTGLLSAPRAASCIVTAS